MNNSNQAFNLNDTAQMPHAQTVERFGYRIHPSFYQFVNEEILSGANLEQDLFWKGLTDILTQFTTQNKALLQKRSAIQEQIDLWHKDANNQPLDAPSYKSFLESIHYIEPQVDEFTIETEDLDDEITHIAGPQLVVPIKNARYAINAANARWGSLYDALYGSDVIPMSGDLAPSKNYNEKRGQAVIQYAKAFLDKCFPLKKGSHQDAKHYELYYNNLMVVLNNGEMVGLEKPGQLIALNGPRSNPESILLINNGLHVQLNMNPCSSIGCKDSAGIEDIKIESVPTVIMDYEDSVAAVDSEDKIEIYRNTLNLLNGTISAEFEKDNVVYKRKLISCRRYTHIDGGMYEARPRSLMLFRNVGLHMMTNMMTTLDDKPVPEGLIDTVITALVASMEYNLSERLRNSKTGSIYIVKPKLHGSEEVQFCCDVFAAVEDILGLKRNTIKIGIMDEERRTSVNLKQCIYAAKQRVFFINTGFLDRTGDEIHTSMQAGPFLAKEEIKQQSWIDAYEKRNVMAGIQCGFTKKAQIGKGMWAMPDLMAEMMQKKIAHLHAGATTSWVPSPTAATLHALHYHYVDVFKTHERLSRESMPTVDALLQIPLLNNAHDLSAEEIEHEIENNVQSILGYLDRWINQGVGCSKVPDMNHVALMEDRATLRISAQLMSNWLLHGICDEAKILATLHKMAELVDKQNQEDSKRTNLIDEYGNVSEAFQAAKDLILLGCHQENGYTEAILHAYRIKVKNTI